MSRNRYVKDYRLVETVNERGRIRTTYEYIGEDYYYAADAATVNAAKKRQAAACLVGWAAYIAALVPVSAAGRTWYAALPFVLTAWPLGLLTGLCASLFFAREPLEHRYADRIENRYPACALFILILSAAALIGEGINLIRGMTLLTGDVVFSACAAILFVCALAVRRLRADLKCRAK